MTATWMKILMNKNPDYRYTESPDGDNWGCIKINNGDYKDLVYRYNLVSFEEGEEKCEVNFTYTIVENCHHYPEGKELKNLMGGILIELLQKRYRESEDIDDYRETDTIESGAE